MTTTLPKNTRVRMTETRRQVKTYVRDSTVIRVDKLASKIGLTRAGILNLALSELLQKHNVGQVNEE